MEQTYTHTYPLTSPRPFSNRVWASGISITRIRVLGIWVGYMYSIKVQYSKEAGHPIRGYRDSGKCISGTYMHVLIHVPGPEKLKVL